MDSPLKIPSCGFLVRDARRRHGLSQTDLAKRAGTDQGSISRIERDQISPSLTTLNRILEAMEETLLIRSVPRDEPLPGAANLTLRELRADFTRLSAEQRLEQAVELSEAQTELAASGPFPRRSRGRA